MMDIRGYRKSDVVATVFIITSVGLWFHMMNLQNAIDNITHRKLLESDDIEQLMIKNTVPVTENISLSHENLLLVTAIPRSGVTVFQKMIAALKTENNFKITSSGRDWPNNITFKSQESQERFCKKIAAIKDKSIVFTPYVFAKFSEFKQKPPILVSIVRDPVERAISTYYYYRSSSAVAEEHVRHPEKKIPSSKHLRKVLESCLSNKSDTECSYVNNQQRQGLNIQYFCGQEPYCSELGNKEALEKAKQTVSSSFAVIGILEKWKKSLVIFEKYLPQFFKGAFKAYSDLPRDSLNQNIFKPKVKEETKKILREKLPLELEFYDFLVTRLDDQYRMLIKT